MRASSQTRWDCLQHEINETGTTLFGRVKDLQGITDLNAGNIDSKFKELKGVTDKLDDVYTKQYVVRIHTLSRAMRERIIRRKRKLPYYANKTHAWHVHAFVA